MQNVTAFSRLSDTPQTPQIGLAEPLNHHIQSLATNKQPDYLNAADEMASHICQHPFENQNEMLLRIQQRLIRDRTEKLESLEKHLHTVQSELETARAALHSITG